jgi:hypothetical protein
LYLFQFAHLAEILEDFLGFGLVELADRKPHVDNHVIADLGFGNIREIDFFDDAPKLTFPVRKIGSSLS